MQQVTGLTYAQLDSMTQPLPAFADNSASNHVTHDLETGLSPVNSDAGSVRAAAAVPEVCPGKAQTHTANFLPQYEIFASFVRQRFTCRPYVSMVSRASLRPAVANDPDIPDDLDLGVLTSNCLAIPTNKGQCDGDSPSGFAPYGLKAKLSLRQILITTVGQFAPTTHCTAVGYVETCKNSIYFLIGEHDAYVSGG